MAGDASGDDVPWGWPWGRWLAALCAVHVLAGVALYEPTLFPGGDNAGYMILGEALRTGEGFRDIYLPEAPLHTKYPPLYPAVLGVLGWIGGLQLFKVASLVMTTGAVALTAQLGRRWAGAGVGLLGGAVLALNPVLLDYSHYVLSEAPFVLLVMGALWWAGARGGGSAEIPGEGRGGRGTPVVLGALLLAAAAFLTRTAGLPLLLAFVLHPAFRRQGRRTAMAAACLVAVAGGWALFQRLGAPGQSGYLQELLMVNPYDPAAGTVGVTGLVERTATNFWRYVSSVLPTSLTGQRSAAGVLAAAGGVATAGLAATGWIRRSLRELGPAELFFFLYVGLISAWPSVWTDQRFLLPLLPLVILYALVGTAALAGRLAGRGGAGGGDGRRKPGDAPSAPAVRAATAGVAVAMLVAGGVSAVGAVPDRIGCVAAYRAGHPCVSPAYESFYGAARWARDHTPQDAVVVNRKPRLFYWVSNRRGKVYPYSSEPAVVLRALDEAGADFVVLDAISGTTQRYLVPAVEARRDRFEVVHQERSPPTWVLRVLPSPGTARAPTRGADLRAGDAAG